MTDNLTGAAAGGGVVLATVIAGLIWVVKRVVPAILNQNRDLINGALENMRANTSAIEANTRATEKAARSFDTFAKVSELQHGVLTKQLDRIENQRDRR